MTSYRLRFKVLSPRPITTSTFYASYNDSRGGRDINGTVGAIALPNNPATKISGKVYGGRAAVTSLRWQAAHRSQSFAI